MSSSVIETLDFGDKHVAHIQELVQTELQKTCARLENVSPDDNAKHIVTGLTSECVRLQISLKDTIRDDKTKRLQRPQVSETQNVQVPSMCAHHIIHN